MRMRAKRSLLISTALVIGAVGAVVGFRLSSARPAPAHHTELADCQRRATAAKDIAIQFAIFHDFPPSMTSLSTQPLWSDACQPGGNPQVAAATFDLSGQATNATVDAFYRSLFSRDGWKQDGTDPQAGGAARYAKNVDGVLYSAEVIYNSWTGKQNITIQLSYRVGT